MSKKLPEGWKEYKLGEIVESFNGNHLPKSRVFAEGAIPVYGANGIVGYTEVSNFNDKLIAIGRVGSIGKINVVDEEVWITDNTIIVKPIEKIALFDYIKMFLQTINYERLRTGTTQPLITKTSVLSLKVTLPPLEEQERIVSILERAESAIQKRKECNRLLDELVKSRFIEMFAKGNYPIVKTEDVCEYITKGTTPKGNEIFEDYTVGLIPYLKVYNLSFDGTMLFNEKPQYVTNETHNGFLARSKVYPDDVLMNIVGPPLGKFSIVPDTFDEWNINQAMAIFRSTDRIKPLYLLHALKQPNVLRAFIDSAVGVRQQNLSLLQCRNLEIPLPPIELQNQFVDFVNQVDKLKFEMEASLKELENNYNSLMQRAFNGELF